MKTNKPLDTLKHWFEKQKYIFLNKVKCFLEKQGFICENEPKCVKYHVAITLVFVFYYFVSMYCVIWQNNKIQEIEIFIVMILNGLCLFKAILKNKMKQRRIYDAYNRDKKLDEYHQVRHPYSFRAGVQIGSGITAISSLIVSNGNISVGLVKGITCMAIIATLLDELLETMESMYQASANYKESKNQASANKKEKK